MKSSLVIISLLCIVSVVMATLNSAEKTALEDIYDKTGGAKWKKSNNWKSASDPCDHKNGWFGVTCANNNTVIKLDLDNNELVGDFPASFFNFPNIITLSLQYNKLTGSLPDGMGNTPKMQELFLKSNDVTGLVPKSIGSTSMALLDLSFNNFNFPLPLEFAKLNDTLLSWNMEGNNLNGPLPSDILINLNQLQSLNFAACGLGATLIGKDSQGNDGDPTLYSHLPDLTHLKLQGNQLTGDLDALDVPQNNLIYLSLSDNTFNAAELFEVNWKNFKSLKSLYLDNSGIFGPFSTKLAESTTLQYLSMQHNKISGALPNELINMAKNNKMSLLLLKNNTLTGSLNPELVKAVVRQIDVSQNHFDCPMPKMAGNNKNSKVITGDCWCALGNQGNNSAKCEPCAAGFFGNSSGGNPGVGGGTCTHCPSNTFSPNTGSTGCTKCATLYSSVPGSKECSGGPLAGLVLGTIAVAGAVGGFFWMRRTNQQRLDVAERISSKALLADLEDMDSENQA